jgi:hypothetical protein
VVYWTISDDDAWPGADPVGALLGLFALVRRFLTPGARLTLLSRS